MKNLLTLWKNEKENQNIKLNLLALKDILKKNYKDDEYFGRKNLLTQWKYWRAKPKIWKKLVI